MDKYEKEILAVKTPLSRSEVFRILDNYFATGLGLQFNDRLAVTENNRIFVRRQAPDDIPKLDIKAFFEGKNHIIRPGKKVVYGYIEIDPIDGEIDFPVSIRIVSLKQDRDLWWIRIAQDILTECRTAFPDFYPNLDIQLPSKSLGNYLVKLSVPDKPSNNSNRELWFEYYENNKSLGIKYTLKDLAKDLHLNHTYVRQLYSIFRRSRNESSEIK